MLIASIFKRRINSDEDRAIYRFIRSRFGIKLKRIKFYREALTHKSYNSISENTRFYERLEFLGDSILDAVIAEYIFKKFPEEDEGFLTQLKSKLVSRNNLSKLAQELDILPLIRYKKSNSINTDTLAGDSFEAIIGAMYLDVGYKKTRLAIKNHTLKYYINMERIMTEEIDFKSKLLIWSQRNKHHVSFGIINEVNHGNCWTYTAEVIINEKEWGRGNGPSKKAAEQEAAKESLILLGEL